MSDILKKARKYFQSPGDVWLFVRVAMWIMILPLFLRRFGLEELIHKITPVNARGRRDPEKLTVYVNWWLHRNVAMFEPTCLKRCLLLYRFLREGGLPVKIHYGIRKKPDGGNEGHSWLSIEGKALPPDGDTAGDYSETYSFPSEEIA